MDPYEEFIRYARSERSLIRSTQLTKNAFDKKSCDLLREMNLRILIRNTRGSLK